MRRAWIATAVLAAGLCAALSPLGADYGNLGCHLNAPRCDEPAWPLEALARGEVGTFVRDQPLMGPVSLVLRAPFAGAARVFHANLTWHYRAGLFACLMLTAALGIFLVRESRARGHPWPYSVAVGALAFLSPVAWSAIDAGHPEELVAAAAVVGSALFVLHGRPTAAAVALGLAVATKAWALLVVAPILLAVPAPARKRAALAVALVVLACYAPLIAGDPGRFHDVVTSAGSLGSHLGETTAPNVWFFESDKGDFTWASEIVNGQVQFSVATGHAVSAVAARSAHTLILVLTLGLTLLWWRSSGPSRPESLLLLLAAILLLRCALDPGNHLYYHVAAATALLGYEAVRPGGRIPWVGGGFIASLWIVDRINDHLRTDAAFAIVYLAWALPTVAGLAFIACRRSRSTPLTSPSPISPRRATASSPG
jgi:hypothetical protein